jgi:hypothetical protein
LQEAFEDMDRDLKFRKEVRVEMLRKLDEPGDDGGFSSLAKSIRHDLDYDIGCGLPPRSESSVLGRPVPVRHIPRFAAHVAVHLRARLGKLRLTEENTRLVEREYLRVCRVRGVHDVDVVSHQGHVMNAFFTEDVLDKSSERRRRLPGWLLKLTGLGGSTGPLQPY